MVVEVTQLALKIH